VLARLEKSRLQRFALVLAVALAACTEPGDRAGLLAPDVQMAVVPGTPEFDQEMGAARAAQAAFSQELMRRPGVVGTAIGVSTIGRPEMLVLVEDASVAVPGSLGGVGVRPVKIVSKDVEAFVSDLKRQPGKDIWLFGGGVLFRSMLEAGLVDRVELAIVPVLLGSGIPVLPGLTGVARLELDDVRRYDKSGIVVLGYRVLGAAT